MEQQKMFGGTCNVLEDKDANIIQKIGIYFREQQNYQRSYELLERVLEVKKRQYL